VVVTEIFPVTVGLKVGRATRSDGKFAIDPAVAPEIVRIMAPEIPPETSVASSREPLYPVMREARANWLTGMKKFQSLLKPGPAPVTRA